MIDFVYFRIDYFPELARQKRLLDRKHQGRRRNYWNKVPRKEREKDEQDEEDAEFEPRWEENEAFEENGDIDEKQDENNPQEEQGGDDSLEEKNELACGAVVDDDTVVA